MTGGMQIGGFTVPAGETFALSPPDGAVVSLTGQITFAFKVSSPRWTRNYSHATTTVELGRPVNDNLRGLSLTSDVSALELTEYSQNDITFNGNKSASFLFAA
jgi:hypothetical protein